MKNRKHLVRTIVILMIWLAIWQIAARRIQNRILFVGPAEVLHILCKLMTTEEFLRTVAHSTARICGGYLLAFAAGTVIGMVSYRWKLLREFLEPAVVFLQSVPVASFVILALIWIGSKNLAVLICFFVVFPPVYRSTLQGMRAADPDLLEMAQVFRMSPGNRLLYIYRPALMPYLMAASRTAVGMAWKSGVAAEVIGVPDLSIGEKLYMAKIYLSTGELFAWTIVIILISKLSEILFLQLLKAAGKPVLLPGGRKKNDV